MKKIRALVGPALLALAPLQFLAGDAVLRAHPARPFGLVSLFGFFLVVGSLLVLIAGLGETGNLLGQAMTRKD